MTAPRPLKVAICGAGPAGLACLRELGRKWVKKNTNRRLHVDVFEACLTPLGLVRHGVAPHNEAIKSAGDHLVDSVSKLNHDSGFTFDYFGGVEIGHWVHLPNIRAAYDATVLTTGARKKMDRSQNLMNIPHEWARGVVSSGEMVEMYNGPPLKPPLHLYSLYEKVPGIMAEAGQWTINSQLLNYSLARSASLTSRDPLALDRTQMWNFGHFFEEDNHDRRVAIIGNGNVSLDIAKVLLTNPRDLSPRFITAPSRAMLNRIYDDKLTSIHILGRRGALNAKWDLSTLRELFVDGRILIREEELRASVEHAVVARELRRNRAMQRMVSLLEEGVVNAKNEKAYPNRTPVWLRFFAKPIAFETDHEGFIRRLVIAKTAYGHQGKTVDSLVTTTSNMQETIEDLSLVVKSVGFSNREPPWNHLMKAKQPQSHLLEGKDGQLGPVYVGGWCRTNAQGNMGSSMIDGTELANRVINDLAKAKSGDDDALSEILCLRLTAPEIGIPVDWEEALHVWRQERNGKFEEWQQAADAVNVLRCDKGARSEAWQDRINEMKRVCMSDHSHGVN